MEIKPCPFCGGEDLTIEHFGFWYTQCNKCGALGADKTNREEAITAWNTRTERTCEVLGMDIHGKGSCSVCDNFIEASFDYCPHCGAKVVE